MWVLFPPFIHNVTTVNSYNVYVVDLNRDVEWVVFAYVVEALSSLQHHRLLSLSHF